MMQPVYYIQTLDQLAALTVPIRCDILFACQKEAFSPNKYSKQAKLSPQNVNYHFAQLFKVGLLYKKYEERKRGAFETFYQTIAMVIRVDPTLFNQLQNSYTQAFLEIDSDAAKLAVKLNERFI